MNERILTEDKSNEQLAWAALICTILSIAFNNYAPMILFIIGWIDHFYKFDLNDNRNKVAKAVNRLKERYPNFVPAIDEEFKGLI